MATRQLNIRLDEALADQLKLMAAAEGISLNQLIVKVLGAAAQKEGPALPAAERFAAIEQRLARLEERLGE